MSTNVESPRIWALASPRAGETAQILALVRLLGEPWIVKRFAYSRLAGPLGLVRAVSAGGLSAGELASPWPDLLVTSNLRNEPVSRWVRVQSGGRTRIVFLGRTWAPASVFDLVVTTLQYRPTLAGNVIVNPLTVHAVDPERPASGGTPGRVVERPASVTGVLIGGNSGPYVLGARQAAVLVEQLRGVRRCCGGNLAVTTSARTPSETCRYLQRHLEPGDVFYEWRDEDAANPYLDILGSADRLVVTGDSVAMLSEAIGTGKPTYVFEIPPLSGDGLRAATYRAGMRFAPRRWTRDVGLVLGVAYSAGWARPLSRFDRDWLPALPDYLDGTVARVRSLLS